MRIKANKQAKPEKRMIPKRDSLSTAFSCFASDAFTCEINANSRKKHKTQRQFREKTFQRRQIVPDKSLDRNEVLHLVMFFKGSRSQLRCDFLLPLQPLQIGAQAV